MAWELVGEGQSFDDFKLLVADRQLPKGARVKFTMDVMWPAGYAFDLAGVEHIFKMTMPEGIKLIDVYGESGSKGVVEGEATSPWLGAVLAFVKAHWVAIIIGGFVLYLVLTNIKFFADFATGLAKALPWVIILIMITFIVVLVTRLRGP